MADNPRIDDLRRRIQKDPASIAFAQLAEELRRARQFEESVEICRAGLATHPGYLSARVTLGRALLELNQLEEAQGELEHVLKNAPENLAAIRGLGEIHHRRGELKEALAQYRAALALARNDPDLEETVAQLARQVEPQKPAIPTDGLSFDQMESELLKLAPRPTVPAAVAPAAQVAPPPPEPAPATSAAHVAPPPPPPAPSPIPIAEPADVAEVEVAPPIEEPVPSEAELEHAARTVAALEQWLDAIHVTRADRRA
jgi:tetratricopeptide (TPR) repeat protein